MIGIIVATHGELSKGLIDASEMIMGRLENIETITLIVGDTPETLQEKLERAISKIDVGDGVMILLDLFGGTPSNVSGRIVKENDVEVVTGVNLSMLLEVMVKRGSHDLRELRGIAVKAGREGIRSINEIVEKIVE
jgi:PTS system mannose-specific IIA component